MADVIKAKIREILSHVLNVSNGQDMETDSIGMETDAVVADGSKVSQVEEGDLVELKSLIKTAPSSDLAAIIEDQEISGLLKRVMENFVNPKDHVGRDDVRRENVVGREVMDIFGTILNGLPPAYLSKELVPELIDGLSSPSEVVNEMWLKSLERVVGNQTAVGDVLNTEGVDIINPVIQLVSRESVSTGKMCENILVSMCKNGYVERVMDKKNIEWMNESISTSGIVKTRILSLMIHISNISDKCLKKVSDTGFLAIITHDSFDPCDPLLSLNCLQLLTELSTTPHGLDFLCGSSSANQTGSSANQTGSPVCPLDKVTSLIVESDFPLSDLLLPGYLTFFASVGSNRPSIVSKYGPTMEKILSHFEGRIPTNTPVDFEGRIPTNTPVDFEGRIPTNTPVVATCFDVIGSIGTSGEGKVVLNQCEGMKHFLTTIGSVISGPSGDLKLSALRSLSLLLTMDGSDLNGHEVSLIIETWFSQLSPIPGSVTKALFAMAQEPFLDHRLGSLEVIRVLSLHQFGQKQLAGLSAVPSGGQSGQQMATNKLPGGHVSFIEYLINRSTEFSKEGKEAKFAIVSELIISPFTISIFGRENYIKLKQYFKEGPFFVSTDSQPQVASRND